MISRTMVFVSFLSISGLAFGHGGGLDGDGCHNDKKNGGYHCHRGGFSGQSFASKAEFQKVKAKGGAEKAAPKK